MPDAADQNLQASVDAVNTAVDLFMTALNTAADLASTADPAWAAEARAAVDAAAEAKRLIVATSSSLQVFRLHRLLLLERLDEALGSLPPGLVKDRASEVRGSVVDPAFHVTANKRRRLLGG